MSRTFRRRLASFHRSPDRPPRRIWPLPGQNTPTAHPACRSAAASAGAGTANVNRLQRRERRARQRRTAGLRQHQGLPFSAIFAPSALREVRAVFRVLRSPTTHPHPGRGPVAVPIRKRPHGARITAQPPRHQERRTADSMMAAFTPHGLYGICVWRGSQPTRCKQNVRVNVNGTTTKAPRASRTPKANPGGTSRLDVAVQLICAVLGVLGGRDVSVLVVVAVGRSCARNG